MAKVSLTWEIDALGSVLCKLGAPCGIGGFSFISKMATITFLTHFPEDQFRYLVSNIVRRSCINIVE